MSQFYTTGRTHNACVMRPSHDMSRAHRRGFTLIELLVVVAIIAILSGLLFPVFMHARDRARKQLQQQQQEVRIPPRPVRARAGLPAAPPPIIDSARLDMALSSSYHRIGMDVFTRYHVECRGEIKLRHHGDPADERVLLFVPFPDNIQEARDVELTAQPGDGGAAPELERIDYNKDGIYYLCTPGPNRSLTVRVNFTALGRDQFVFTLPAARQMRSLDVRLRLAGVSSHTIPDDALQPSAASNNELHWQFKNLVSDRRIEVLIPAAQSPLARVLLLSRLVALAVLLFGAGFWFVSEKVKPGQLDGFRWGHFLLLAVTYSLFFVIFAVLEFHGALGTPVSMALAAIFSWPLLVLHVSRVLNFKFAVGSVLPLAIFTLGLVINGVYGGDLRDYIFIAAVIATIAYLTVSYESWAAGREVHLREQQAHYTARRKEIVNYITTELGMRIAGLNAAAGRAAEITGVVRRSPPSAEIAAIRSRLEKAREPVMELRKDYKDLAKRLSYIPASLEWEAHNRINDLERDARAFQDRLEPQLALLQAELQGYQPAVTSSAGTADISQTHCVCCGRQVPEAPFCQQCGCVSPYNVTCSGCGERIIIPLHLVPEGQRSTTFHCPNCGTAGQPSTSSPTPATTEAEIEKDEEA